MSAAFVAVSAQLKLASITFTVVPDTEQPVDDPALKLKAPVPVPPVAVAVPVVPKVTLDGPVTVSAAWSAFTSVTGNGALVAGL